MRTSPFPAPWWLWWTLVAAGPLAAQVWSVDNQVVTLPLLQASAAFGHAVAIGNFNGDSADDFVVGAPFWNSPSVNVGRWEVFLGSTDRVFSTSGGYFFSGAGSVLAGWSLAAGDFDNDGRDEIAIGGPGGDVEWDGATRTNAGLVLIFQYESNVWMSSPPLNQADDLFTPPETYDKFGEVLAVGNFNGDDYDDLAIGVPYEDWGAAAETGVVHVYYGSASGISRSGITSFYSPNRAAAEYFGWQLAAGDFDGDGYDDLAVGVPFRTIATLANAGQVEVYFGGSSGLVASSPQVLSEATFGHAVAANDEFGGRLAAGNFNQSESLCLQLATTCYDDLAISVIGQLVGFASAGKVIVGYGSSSGISASGSTTLIQESVGATSELEDYFGLGLAAGHLDSDPFAMADLAIGTPSEDQKPGRVGDGVLYLTFGDPGGLNSAGGAQTVAQEPGFGIAPAADNDGWGLVMAIGDLDGDGAGDLVVGVPSKDPGGVAQSGAVQVLFGAMFADGFETGDTSAW